MRRLVFAGLLVGLAGVATAAFAQPGAPPGAAQPQEKVQDKGVKDKDLGGKDKDKGAPAPAYLEIRIHPRAGLTFDGSPTRQRGPIRYFYTPPLVPGFKYTYVLTATWPDKEGKPKKDSKTVNVSPGETTRVEFPDSAIKEKPKDKDKDKEKPKDKDKEKPKDKDKEKPKDKDKKPDDKGATTGW